MRISLIASLLLTSATLSATAFADTVTFASTPGVTTFSGPISGTGSSMSYPNPAYAAPLSGSVWVSPNSTGGYQAGAEYVSYTDSFTLLAGESYAGSISFMADDHAGVAVNGVEIYPISPSSGYLGSTTVGLISSYFVAGTNTITLETYNQGGPGAADFAGSLTSIAPEPSSLILLGTGLFGIAGAGRRRFRTI